MVGMTHVGTATNRVEWSYQYRGPGRDWTGATPVMDEDDARYALSQLVSLRGEIEWRLLRRVVHVEDWEVVEGTPDRLDAYAAALTANPAVADWVAGEMRRVEDEMNRMFPLTHGMTWRMSDEPLLGPKPMAEEGRDG